MNRFAVLFAVVFVISVALMAGMMAINGLNLFNFSDTRALIMLAVALAVALYVSFRISLIIAKRQSPKDPNSPLKGAQKSKLLGVFAPKKSPSLVAREARVAARREKLVREGKIEAENAPVPTYLEDENPVRVAASAPIKDRMAARKERVRRAKETGKLDG